MRVISALKIYYIILNTMKTLRIFLKIHSIIQNPGKSNQLVVVWCEKVEFCERLWSSKVKLVCMYIYMYVCMYARACICIYLSF
jgi:hypothetical protein